jgi:ribosomal protein S18 acetylase RimI-like enzyme
MISNETDAVEPIDTPHGTLRRRPETVADVSFLCALHASAKAEGFAMLRVGEPIRQQLLDMQFRAMTLGYRTSFPEGRFEVITLNEAPIGRLITDLGRHRFHIVYIALLPEWQQRQIGTVLLSQVLEQPRRRGMRCEATVALDNLPSRHLWLRLGFAERERDGANLVLEWPPG